MDESYPATDERLESESDFCQLVSSSILAVLQRGRKWERAELVVLPFLSNLEGQTEGVRRRDEIRLLI